MPALPSRRLALTALLAGEALAAAPGEAGEDGEGVDVLVPADVLADHQARRTPRRDLVELDLLQRAVPQRLRLVPMPSTARLLIELRGRRALLSGTSFTRSDVDLGDGRLALSEALVREGEFEAGLYALPDHPARRDARQLHPIDRWSALSSRAWRSDWAALQGLGLREVLHVAGWPKMVRMLAAGRADFVLAPFSAAPDLAIRAEGVTLLPVPGVKLGLAGSRHFVLSRLHPRYAGFVRVLDDGLRRLHRSGHLRKAYQASGFFNPAVRDWARLGAAAGAVPGRT